jgi:TolB protein
MKILCSMGAFARPAGMSILALIIFVTAAAVPARAQLRVDITRGTVEPMPIAIPEFYGKTPQETETGRNMANLISADLERSGLFKPIDRRAFIQKLSARQVQPRFGDWRQINAQALVAGSTQAQSDGRLKVEFRLWDVFGGTQMTGLAYFTTPDNWRRVAHIIADEIYKRITGESGYFDTRVVYISEQGPSNKRIKRLAIMDQDGANHRFLTDGRALVLTPRFSPKAQEITYLSYGSGQPRVYIYNIDTGQQEVRRMAIPKSIRWICGPAGSRG